MSQRRAKESRRKVNGKSAQRPDVRDTDSSPKPGFEIEQLEPRILLLATWTGTDGAESGEGAVGGGEFGVAADRPTRR